MRRFSPFSKRAALKEFDNTLFRTLFRRPKVSTTRRFGKVRSYLFSGVLLKCSKVWPSIAKESVSVSLVKACTKGLKYRERCLFENHRRGPKRETFQERRQVSKIQDGRKKRFRGAYLSLKGPIFGIFEAQAGSYSSSRPVRPTVGSHSLSQRPLRDREADSYTSLWKTTLYDTRIVLEELPKRLSRTHVRRVLYRRLNRHTPTHRKGFYVSFQKTQSVSKSQRVTRVSLSLKLSLSLLERSLFEESL